MLISDFTLKESEGAGHQLIDGLGTALAIPNTQTHAVLKVQGKEKRENMDF